MEQTNQQAWWWEEQRRNVRKVCVWGGGAGVCRGREGGGTPPPGWLGKQKPLGRGLAGRLERCTKEVIQGALRFYIRGGLPCG